MQETSGWLMMGAAVIVGSTIGGVPAHRLRFPAASLAESLTRARESG